MAGARRAALKGSRLTGTAQLPEPQTRQNGRSEPGLHLEAPCATKAQLTAPRFSQFATKRVLTSFYEKHQEPSIKVHSARCFFFFKIPPKLLSDIAEVAFTSGV